MDNPVHKVHMHFRSVYYFRSFVVSDFMVVNKMMVRVGAISKFHVSTPRSFTFVLKSTMNTKKWYLKVNNHPLIGFLVL